VAEFLGWPWSPTKCLPFSSTFPYLGFDWDLAAKTVSIPEKKCLKFLSKLDSWTASSSVSISEAQSLIGSLNHCCAVILSSRTHLPLLYRFLAAFPPDNPFTLRRLPKDVLLDAAWWRTILMQPWVGLKLGQIPPPSNATIYVDASHSWGIGLVINDKWLAWPLKKGWHSDGRDIGWAEFIALELALVTVTHAGWNNLTIHIYSDNTGVIGAFRSGSSRSSEQNTVLRRIILSMHDHNIHITTSYVPSAQNLADGPSRGNFLPWSQLFSKPPKVPTPLATWLAPCVQRPACT
jgi:hypothetical protein